MGLRISKSRTGFTMIELLVTLAIMALVMTALLATLQGTVRAHDEAAVEISSVRDGPRILDMVERDLRALHVYNMKDNVILKGTSERPAGLRGDRVDFLCTNDSARRIADTTGSHDSLEDVASDVNEVGYRLRSSSRSDEFMEMWRREDLFVDDEPFEGGTYEKIHDRIRRFELTYLDHLGEKAEEKDEWDMAEEKRLPGAVRIDLELQADPEVIGGFVDIEYDAERIYSYTRVVAFASDETVALNVRPYLPTKITGRNDNAGFKSGGKEGEEGGAGGDEGTGGGMGQDGLAGGGSSIKDIMDQNGGTLPGSGNSDGNMRIDLEGPTIDVNPGSDGKLSEQDQQKIENFINDYRNRYGGKAPPTPSGN